MIEFSKKLKLWLEMAVGFKVSSAWLELLFVYKWAVQALALDKAETPHEKASHLSSTRRYNVSLKLENANKWQERDFNSSVYLWWRFWYSVEQLSQSINVCWIHGIPQFIWFKAFTYHSKYCGVFQSVLYTKAFVVLHDIDILKWYINTLKYWSDPLRIFSKHSNIAVI